ncbi:somatostatin receptor type 4-like [Tubulanus polymorphus]|uniref:somatostatin receptor type 4-like n=1 Tax=Tubulanus polymorphus TaxID=672921 RepID=UPI003DA4B647
MEMSGAGGELVNLTYESGAHLDVCYDESCINGEYALLQMISACFIAVICPIGIVLNILSVIVLLAENSKTAQNVFLISLAISDTIFLLYSLVHIGISCFVEIAIESCRFYFKIGQMAVYCRYFARIFTFWMVVVVTIHRFLAVRHPLRVRNFSAKNAGVVTGIVFALSVAVGICLTELIKRAGRPRVKVLGTIIRLLMACILPIGIVFVCNSFMIYTVKQARSFRRSASTNRENPRASSNADDPSIRIIAVSTVFLISSIPFVVSTSLYLVSDPLFKEMSTVSGISLCVNSSVNFVLYFYTGSRFRVAFRRKILRVSHFRGSMLSRETEMAELNAVTNSCKGNLS